MLAREGVIDEGTAGTLVAAIGFRNVLAHEYGHVNYDEVYETLQTGLSVYDTYSQTGRTVDEEDELNTPIDR